MDQVRRRPERRSVSLLVKLKHENVVTFEEEFATNLSDGGMFIRSRQPQAVGTHLKFEIQLAGGQRMMRGTALVRWIRQPGDPAGSAGMGIEFEELDEPTRALVDRLLLARPPQVEALPDEIAELEAELRLRGAAAPARIVPSLPPIAPVAPLVPSVAPVSRPARASAPTAAAAQASAAPQMDSLFDDVPLDLEIAPPPADAIDLPMDALLEDTPPPSSDDVFNLLMGGDSLPGASPELEVPLLDLDVMPEDSEDDSSSSGVELDFGLDAPSGLELEVPEPFPVVRRVAAPEPPKPAPTLLREAPKVVPPPPRNAGPVFLRPPSTLSETGPVIGIDLGTTNSCVALLQGNRPVILRSREGYNTVPSVLSLTAQGKLLLSHRAKSQLILNPSQTIYGAKRLVGRPFDSAVVRQVRERFHYDVVPDENGRAAVRLGNNVLSLEEVQGLVLKECRDMAEQFLGQTVGRAVITVPAYYSEPQREAVRRAGAMAGLKVERILNEPTAAALAFGLNKQLNKKILVYDLGGGTFDATILKIEKNVFEVMGTGGDVFLGGIDFDNLLVDYLLKRFLDTEGIAFEGDQIALSRITEAAERAKCALSERESYDIRIPMLMVDSSGRPRDLRCTLTRAEIDMAATPLVTRTLDVVRDVLLDAKLRPKEVDEIILVGGMSRMPMVREKLKEMFGKAPHAGVNADEAVALGAALYCGTVDKVSSVTLIDVLPMTIGIGIPGGGFKRVMERNTALPAQKSFSLSTSRDNETMLEFSVFQGEDNNVAGNEYLGTVRIEELPRAPKGVVRVSITLRLDAECVLHVEANELSTRRAVKATLATRYTSDEVQQKLGITAEKAREVEEVRAKELETRGGSFWGFLKKVIRKK